MKTTDRKYLMSTNMIINYSAFAILISFLVLTLFNLAVAVLLQRSIGRQPAARSQVSMGWGQ